MKSCISMFALEVASRVYEPFVRLCFLSHDCAHIAQPDVDVVSWLSFIHVVEIHTKRVVWLFIQLLAKGQRCILQSSLNHPLILHCRQWLDSAVGSICLQKSPRFDLYFYAFLGM